MCVRTPRREKKGRTEKLPKFARRRGLKRSIFGIDLLTHLSREQGKRAEIAAYFPSFAHIFHQYSNNSKRLSTATESSPKVSSLRTTRKQDNTAYFHYRRT